MFLLTNAYMSGILPCLSLKFLHSAPFQSILSEQSTLYICIFDALLIYTRKTILSYHVDKLKVEHTTEFTYAIETNNTTF